jgi:hypothetical protein
LRDLDIGLLKSLDDKEWERLQAEYHDRVYGYIKRQIGDPDLAEDLTQDTFLGAVRGIRNFDTRYNVEQFLMGIARNKVIICGANVPRSTSPTGRTTPPDFLERCPVAPLRPRDFWRGARRCFARRGHSSPAFGRWFRSSWTRGNTNGSWPSSCAF